MGYGEASYFLDKFEKFDSMQHHLHGCDFHEDAPEFKKSRRTGRFMKKMCKCADIYDNMIN